MRKIAIIGLGYVGLPLSLEFSKKNFVGPNLGKKGPKWTKIEIFGTFFDLDKNKIISFF